MIHTKKTETVQNAIRAYELNEQIKSMSKELDALKSWFKGQIGTEGAMEAGPMLITLVESERTSLDRNALIIDLGAERLKKYEKKTPVKAIHFKKVGG